MVTMTIDGKPVTARAGAFLLEAARGGGIDIPTLCHHEALEPYGGCRLCLVDVTEEGWDGWCKMVIACQFPVKDGLIVFTGSERVVETRKVVLDLLLARCPETPLIKELATRYGITRTTYRPNPQPTDCILCALCTRVCDHIGVSAIATVDRGIGREVAPPFGEAPPDCIGCPTTPIPSWPAAWPAPRSAPPTSSLHPPRIPPGPSGARHSRCCAARPVGVPTSPSNRRDTSPARGG